ncbi:hypothetical protein Cch01nite_37910 [Cellulomonas chitinilytica]|uniref:Uncharacterized protein n=1 Tax=Cellulomonas chitinilytica TaxID=398759 RepID=A0A919P483_9CELL|nr:hypothetical protein Cch01nite_37910 [Cellulomonas chitinilytica]
MKGSETTSTAGDGVHAAAVAEGRTATSDAATTPSATAPAPILSNNLGRLIDAPLRAPTGIGAKVEANAPVNNACIG